MASLYLLLCVCVHGYLCVSACVQVAHLPTFQAAMLSVRTSRLLAQLALSLER